MRCKNTARSAIIAGAAIGSSATARRWQSCRQARAARYYRAQFRQRRRQERADLRELERSRQADLTAKGMVFNQLDAVQFRAALVKAGLYGQWQKT